MLSLILLLIHVLATPVPPEAVSCLTNSIIGLNIGVDVGLSIGPSSSSSVPDTSGDGGYAISCGTGSYSPGTPFQVTVSGSSNMRGLLMRDSQQRGSFTHDSSMKNCDSCTCKPGSTVTQNEQMQTNNKTMTYTPPSLCDQQTTKAVQSGKTIHLTVPVMNDCTVHWVLCNSDTQPTVSQIQSGQDSSGNAALKAVVVNESLISVLLIP